MNVQESMPRGFDRHYIGVSPQLLARVRQNWVAQRLDLDTIWRDSIPTLPGFTEIDNLSVFPDSRPIDLLMLFDQGCCWVDALRHAAEALQARPGDGKLERDQVRGLFAVTTRLRDELAAVRTLTIAGLSMPAMQISRAISEDVDLALALMVRRKLAQAFAECRSPEDAAEFWRRHVAGGRAFRLVAQALYRFGLDYSEDSEYVRWRKEVLVFLGSAVHSSFVGMAASEGRSTAGKLNPASQECIYFTTIRMQELCAYSQVIGGDLKADLTALEADCALAEMRLRFARDGGEIIIDQMRWLTGTRVTPAGTNCGIVH
jgi:hypothetical protein